MARERSVFRRRQLSNIGVAKNQRALQPSALAPRARGRRRRAASDRRDCPPWQPRRYQARRHHPLLSGSQALYWRSLLCPRLADPRQCRVYCRGRYQPQSLLRCRHWRLGASVPTEQPTPVARYRRLRRADCRRPCRHYRLTDADAPAKPCAHQASEPAAHKPAHASAETDGVLPFADAATRPDFFSSATLAPPPCLRSQLTPSHRYRRRGPRPT